MVDFSSAGIAALAQPLVCGEWLAWLDITGDVMRVTTGAQPVSFTAGATGDPDLDGFTFGRTDGLIHISEATQKQGGADSVTAYLSGLSSIDTTTLNQLGTKSNWQGRQARLWILVRDPVTRAPISVRSYYSGYMMTPRLAVSVSAATIALEIESYLASRTQASGRSYLGQAEYDSGDQSAAASISAANGISALGNVATMGGGGLGVSGGIYRSGLPTGSSAGFARLD